MKANVEQLAWLHDSAVHSIQYNVLANGDREIALTVLCDADLEYELWAGRRVILVATDVRMSKHVMWSEAGDESLDEIRLGVSSATRAMLRDSENKGLPYVGNEYSIAFHSGSVLELLCTDLEVIVHD